ncbi:MAG: hypothetical protein DDT37_00046 [Firmicutes bacterium]|nr:hypothetical protein [candidate division NPL-UPA2 bacterium]
MMDKCIYPAVFEPCEEGGYTVVFPDLPGCITEGDAVDDALAMAKEVLELYLYGLERKAEKMPPPSNPAVCSVPAGGFVSLVEAWMPAVRYDMATKSVKKTLTIPSWLNDHAEQQGINYSQLLQAALKEHLGVKEPSYAKQYSTKGKA